MNFKLNTSNLSNLEARYELVKTMRASILVLGSMIAKYGYAKIALPGGCAIGSRPVNYHLKALEKLGAKISLNNGYIEAKAEKLIGAKIKFEGVTVTGTENLMMAASLAEGVSTLTNVAKEPEISDLADFLNSMGAKISGAGTDEIKIEGVNELHGATFKIPADRIEAGTYLVAAAITNGKIIINKIDSRRMLSVVETLKKAGAKVKLNDNSISLDMTDKEIKPVDIVTEPFPGFPTDMQAQFTVLNCLGKGESHVKETIFENRFMHVQELNRMGTEIIIDGTTAIINGVDCISGAQVMATDLRASASLILAGLVAKGETIVDRIYHIDRGYERIEEKLSNLGAEILRLPN
jgi:UDP-N-acetylglucosamine 1-carboxyvinyltransferase